MNLSDCSFEFASSSYNLEPMLIILVDCLVLKFLIMNLIDDFSILVWGDKNEGAIRYY